MKASEIAGKLLELFGPDGEHFDANQYRHPGAECLVTGCNEVGADFADLYGFLPEKYTGLAEFAMDSDWPTVKSWLEGIREEK